MERKRDSNEENIDKSRKSRYYRREKNREDSRFLDIGSNPFYGEAFTLNRVNYDAAGIAEQIARDKIRALDYDSEGAAWEIIDRLMPNSLVEMQAEETAGQAWRRKEGTANY